MKAIALFLQLSAAFGLLHSAKAQNNTAKVAFQMPIQSEWKDILDEAIHQYTMINPDDYECSAAPDKKAWFDSVLGQVQDLNELIRLESWYGILSWAYYYSWLIDMDDSDEVFGNDNGQQGKEYQRRFGRLQTFWDIKSDDILLKAMKSSVLADTDKMVHMFRYYFLDQNGNPYSDEQARSIVAEVQAFIESDPGVGYDFPLLTFNAFAVTSVGFETNPYVGNVPDNILMGDGLLEYFGAVGLDANGPEMILAHEFAHHIQFELDLFDLFAAGTPEATRKLELMADAYSAYFLAHNKGASFQKNRIVDVFKTAFDFGDCRFGNRSHHGTPNQREKAAEFGASLVSNGNKILKAADFLSKFEAEYAEIIAADSVES